MPVSQVGSFEYRRRACRSSGAVPVCACAGGGLEAEYTYPLIAVYVTSPILKQKNQKKEKDTCLRYWIVRSSRCTWHLLYFLGKKQKRNRRAVWDNRIVRSWPWTWYLLYILKKNQKRKRVAVCDIWISRWLPCTWHLLYRLKRIKKWRGRLSAISGFSDNCCVRDVSYMIKTNGNRKRGAVCKIRVVRSLPWYDLN